MSSLEDWTKAKRSGLHDKPPSGSGTQTKVELPKFLPLKKDKPSKTWFYLSLATLVVSLLVFGYTVYLTKQKDPVATVKSHTSIIYHYSWNDLNLWRQKQIDRFYSEPLKPGQERTLKFKTNCPGVKSKQALIRKS